MKSTEKDIEAKVKAIDTKQYYQLNPYERLQDDDVETVNHRYDTSNDVTFEQAKSLAEEIREESEKNTTTRLEPPPDLLVSSNLRRKIWPEVEVGFQNEAFNEDWDMILDNEVVQNPDETAVDIVVRQQPTNTEPSTFYRNARRMVVHQVQGVDVKPSCGKCCILQ